MADDNTKKQINNALEEALKEFEGAGGFDGGNRPPPKKEEHENPFEQEMDSLPHKEHPQDHDDDYIEYEHDDSNHDEELDHDFDVMNDSLDEDEHVDDVIEEKNVSRKKTEKKKSNDDGDGSDGGGSIVQKFKEPKNMIMLIIAVCFVLFLVLGGDKKKKDKKDAQTFESDIASEVSDVTSIADDVSADVPPPTPKKKKQEQQEVSVSDIDLPSLDIQMPEIKKEDTDLTPKIPEIKTPEDAKEKKKLPDIEVEEIKIRGKDEEKPRLKDIDDIPTEAPKKKREQVAKKEGEQVKPLVTDFGTENEMTLKPSKAKKNSHDFIFMDTDLDIEKENANSTISATKIQNPENVIAQGRIIDAVLETSVNSSISGQVRAIVTRDVYAEVGRNILIPMGTRLYGEYGGASTGAVGSGGTANSSRIVIRWSRIMRPDTVYATIDSYASDQFGRSGIAGQVDNNYLGGITSSVLLSTIPLITTIVANAITNTNPQTVTVGSATGSTTVVQDPVNIATQAFTKSVGQIVTDVTKNAISTSPIITLDQGTRVRVLVNKDIKLPTYKALTKASGNASVE